MAIRKTKKRSFIQWVFIILTILSVLCLVISYVAFYISPAKVWFLAFFGLAYPLILAVNILFVILWLLWLKKYIWIPLIAILIGISHVLSLIQIRSNEGIPVSGSLKILSYNIHGIPVYSKKQDKDGGFSDILSFISEQQPDILCLQEFNSRSNDSSKVLERISDQIKMKYFYFKNYFDVKITYRINALVIFSKYPIIRSGFFQNDHKNTYAIYTDVSIGDEIIRVYNVHLEPFHFGQEDYTFYSDIAEGESPKIPLKEASLKIIKKLRNGNELRAKQAENLRQSIKNSPHPKLVCGDLNDIPSSYTYQVLSSGLRDGFKKAGNGLIGNTYGGNFPSFRIDYILFDKKFEAYNYMKHQIFYSDHYPISAFINIHPAE